MSTTVNTFPPLHLFDSPRSWFLACIVLLHVGFFWALNNGFSFSKILLPPPHSQVVFLPQRPEPAPTPTKQIVDWIPTAPRLRLPTPTLPNHVDEREDAISGSSDPQPLPPIQRSTPEPQPTIVQPAIPNTGLSEPLYPASEIRAGHTGTVLLSVQVLENGRVGEVRLLQSSGFAKLDQSALREARKWRFVPGTRDGVPVVLWKHIPIKFELTENSN